MARAMEWKIWGVKPGPGRSAALLALATILTAFAAGCGGKSKSAPVPAAMAPDPAQGVSWSFQPGGIVMALKADRSLNLYDDKPHTVVLCVYQLSDPSKFNDLLKTSQGVIGLLPCERFDPSVASTQKLIVYPGEERTLKLDRAEKARFVGVVAGYYEISPPQVARLFPIDWEERTEGWVPLFKDTYREPVPLVVNLLLGPREIQEVGSR